MPRVVLTIRARIREIDAQIASLRSEQKGLEKALSIALGQSELVSERKNGDFNG